jgi:hypothetical protein
MSSIFRRLLLRLAIFPPLNHIWAQKRTKTVSFYSTGPDPFIFLRVCAMLRREDNLVSAIFLRVANKFPGYETVNTFLWFPRCDGREKSDHQKKKKWSSKKKKVIIRQCLRSSKNCKPFGGQGYWTRVVRVQDSNPESFFLLFLIDRQS